MPSKRVQNLIIKYFTNNTSFSEMDELESWLNKANNEKEFVSYVKTNYLINYNLKNFDASNAKKSLNDLIRKEKKIVKLKRIGKIMKYAAILVVIIASSYFIKTKSHNNPVENTPVIVDTKIESGTSKAILTLEDGSVLKLEKGATLKIKNAYSNGTEIVYKTKNKKEQKLSYNYLTVPRGGQYFVKLSDGTKVWLNSESKLKYPVNFIKGQTRDVELVYGEAYFDVSPSIDNGGAEFKVFNNKQEIRVLGTEFNIKAYKDETNIYTTLVEGKVEVNYDNAKRNLKPNQQSNIDINSGLLLIKMVDVYNEVSWKEGVFSFEDKSLKEIMKILSRWYDIEVEFKNDKIKEEEFIGVIGKEQKMEDILINIKNFGIIKNYEINDKKIVLE